MRPVAVLLTVAFGLMACGRGTPHGANVPGAATIPVSLPDVSAMAPTVQAQVQASYAAAVRVYDDRTSTTVDRAQALGALGKLLMAAQVAAPAEAAFAEAAHADPSDYRWPYYLAHVYRTQGRIADAQQQFARVLTLRPEDPDALYWQGDLQLTDGQPAAAHATFSCMVTLAPQSISAHYGLGRAALALSDYRRAVEELELVLSRDASAAAAHYPLSLAYAGLGDTAEAADHLRQRREHLILPADPLLVELDALLESAQSYETMGIRALNRGDWPAAESAFRRGLALSPQSAALHHRLGAALSQRGDLIAAQAEFEQAIAADPRHFLAQYSLGVLLQDQRRLRDALPHYRAAVEARPTYAEARLRYASALRTQGQYAEAVAQFDAVPPSAPEAIAAAEGAAITLMRARRERDARARLETALAASPRDLSLQHTLARVLATADDASVRDGARAVTLIEAVASTQRSPDVGETIAMAMAAVGRFDEAVAIQQDLLRAAVAHGATAITARLTSRLRAYQRHDRCHEGWTVEETQ